MTISSAHLTAAAGLCAAAAGAIFVGVQVGHPPVDVATIGTPEMLARESAKVVMAVLALAGVTGVYVHQHRRVGALGLAGYVLLVLGYLAMLAQQVVVGYVLPVVAATDPAYVQDVLVAAMGGAPTGDIGHLQQVMLLSGIGYAGGGLLLGVALFRAGDLARWAALLLAVGTTSALTLSVLPAAFDRPMAVPTGIALMGLGVSLFRRSRSAGTAPAPVRAARPAVAS